MHASSANNLRGAQPGREIGGAPGKRLRAYQAGRASLECEFDQDRPSQPRTGKRRVVGEDRFRRPSAMMRPWSISATVSAQA